MSQIEEIEIVIDRDGKTRLLVRGVRGEDCLDITAELEAKLGALLGEREKTSEYYEAPLESREARLKTERGE